MTLTEMLATTIATHGDCPALSDNTTTLTYTQLGERADTIAQHLINTGIKPDDRIALSIPNTVEFADWYYGTLRAGAIAVPLNPALRTTEIEAQLRHVTPALLITHPDTPNSRQAAHNTQTPTITITPGHPPTTYLNTTNPTTYPHRSTNDLAVLLFTSGTTSTPKAAMLTHHNLVTNATICADIIKLTPNDTMLGSLPLFHAFGQTVCLNVVLATGAHTILQPQFNPRQALNLITKHAITCITAVPSMYNALAFVHNHPNHTYNLNTIKWGISGGAPLAPELHDRLTHTLGFPIIEGYGLSETSPVVLLNQGTHNRPGSVGTPLPGITINIIDPETGETLPTGHTGELTVHGHAVMRGYWNDPQATNETLHNGTLRTGDIARINHDGYVEIVDRRKDLIIVGGENVYPREIEDTLYTHPAVAECAVLGIPDPTRGEAIIAAITTHDNTTTNEQELRDHVRKHLAPFKVPRHIWFTTEIPKGSTGKNLKRAITIPKEILPNN